MVCESTHSVSLKQYSNFIRATGSSTACGNAGIPATPRDGSPIELVALQASALRWLAKLQDDGVIDRHVLVRLKVFPCSARSCPARAFL